jgi:hypothetical protein
VRLDVWCEQRFLQRWHGLACSPSVALPATVSGARPPDPECVDMLTVTLLLF